MTIMPLAKGQNGTAQSVATTDGWVTIFNATDTGMKQERSMIVGCNSASTGTYMLCRVSPMHIDIGVPIYKGAFIEFDSSRKIEKVEVKAGDGTVLVDWGVNKD